MRNVQQQGKDISVVLAWKEKNERLVWQDISAKSLNLKILWSKWDSLQVGDGIVHRIWESVDGCSNWHQLVVPKALVPDVLKRGHSDASSGHLGVTKTLAKVRECFYWPTCGIDVEDCIQCCGLCNASKGPTTRGRAKTQVYNVGYPFERIAANIAGPIPETGQRNRCILVVGTVATALVENWISRFGVPLELHSDRKVATSNPRYLEK